MTAKLKLITAAAIIGLAGYFALPLLEDAELLGRGEPQCKKGNTCFSILVGEEARLMHSFESMTDCEKFRSEILNKSLKASNCTGPH